MKRILLSLIVLFISASACGEKKGPVGPAGKDAESPAKAEDGVDGADAITSSVHCDYKLVYPHDKHPYLVDYSEVTFSEGTVLASFAMTYSATGQQLFREAMLFAEGEPVVIVGQNWIASKTKLIHKASGTEYKPVCK